MHIDSRERFIIDSFRKHFTDTEEPLLLYGTGRGTRAILQELLEYHIVGILDKTATGGKLLGMPILDLETAGKTGAEKVVIVATQRHVPVIYRRIADFCKEKNIAAYDVNGQELAKRYDCIGGESAGEILFSKGYGGADKEIAGAFIRTASESPFVSEEPDGRLRITDMSAFAELFFAPLALGYALWLMEQIREKNCDYVLYMSRDAYLIQKIVARLCRISGEDAFPEGEYFYVSRRAVSAAQVFDNSDIERLTLEPFYGTIGEQFRLRFDINVETKYADQPATDTELIRECLKRYEQAVLTGCARERENYLAYVQSTHFAGKERIAVIDLYAHGTVQRGLEKILQTDFYGFYLKKNMIYGEEDAAENGSMKWWSMFEPGYLYAGNDPLNNAMVWMEEIFSSQEPTLHGFDEAGQPVFQQEPRSSAQLQQLKQIQERIQQYCENMVTACPNLLQTPASSQVLADILEVMDERYIDLCFEEKNTVVIGDGFSRPLAVEAVQR